MEYFVEHRYVALTGPVTVQGTRRRGRHIAVALECVDHQDSLEQHLSLIKAAAEGKVGPGRYGREYELLIVVEDRWFEPAKDSEEIVAFVTREVLSLQLEFGAVHLVGLMGRLFLSFPVGRNES